MSIIAEWIVAVGVMSFCVAGVVWYRDLNQKKNKSDEVEPKDVDLPEANPPSAAYDEDELVSCSLLEKLAEFPGSHRKVITPPIFLKGTQVKYETRRGGWSQAKIVAKYDRFVLLNRQGTEFIRSVQFT